MLNVCLECHIVGVCSKAIRGFSIFTNAPAVLCTKTKDEAISCIYGLRFFSMLWVMLGNTYIYAALSLSDAPVAGKKIFSRIFVLTYELEKSISLA